MKTQNDYDYSRTMLKHGGALRAAAEKYRIPLSDWLDLSTGINPQGWPVPPLPASVWRRLPELEDGLEQAAADYYGTDQLLAVAGSQAAIQLLPLLRSTARVGVLKPSYAEHAHAWRKPAHQLCELSIEDIDDAISKLDVLIIINPNNPTGIVFEPEKLLEWHLKLTQRNGWLIIDEAFIDTTPEQSLAAHAGKPGLIILRSLGKFFGLAGVRLGFVMAEQPLRRQLEEKLGPWAVNGPARWIAKQALIDRAWQQQTKMQLRQSSERLAMLLQQYDLPVSGGSNLFQWVLHEAAETMQDQLAKQGILVRYFVQPASLRFGLPGNEAEWDHLQRGLSLLSCK